MGSLQEWGAWDRGKGEWQRVLNARPIPPRHRQRDVRDPIAVDARLVWERDGAEWIATRAFAWCVRDVLVEVLDPRLSVHGVWVPVEDVRRRAVLPAP